MRRSLSVLVLTTLATAPSTAVGQDAPRPATVEDVLAFKSLESPVISPDGAWVAYVVRVRDMEENDYDADIWLVATDGGAPVQLTRGPGFDGDPAWSHDATWIAFRSDRGEEDQVYGIQPGGGEAWPVTSAETGVGAFALSPDGSRIAWVATSPETEADEELEKERGQPIVADSAYATEWAHLWTAPLVDRVAGDAVRSSPDEQHVTDVVWAPDSRAVAWSARPSPQLSSYADEAVYVLNEAGAEVRQVTTMPGGVGTVDWSDAGLLVWGSADRMGTSNERIWRVAPRGSTDPIALTDGLDEHAELVWAGPDALLVEASRGPYRGLVRVPLDDSGGGNPEWVYDGPLFAGSFSASKDGSRIAFVGESPTQPRDLYVADAADVRPRRLTDVNPQAGGLAWGETRTVTWRSRADGEEIEGILTLPVGYAERDRVPLLLRIHGGPSGVSTMSFLGDDLAYPTQVFAGLGYAVLQPNYRGSTGYGERFRGLNRGDISGRDWIDVDSGVDHLIELGIADPDRLGIMGWSFGGHHTYWGITQTDRYKAASAGAGANELVSMFHQTDLPDFYHTYLGPSPWEDWQLYEERSAYRRVERVTTPLLIQVGENDARVPKEQSRMFYEAMRDIGKAPVKMVTYPGQPHGIQEPRLQRDVMTRNVDWFRHWIPVEGG